MTTDAKEPEKKKGRVPAPPPAKAGEGKGGWTIVEVGKEGRFLCRSDAGRFEIALAPWTKDYVKIAGPIKDEAVARSIFETGKVPEKPAPKEKKETTPAPK